MKVKTLVWPALGGVVVALPTGLVSNMPPMWLGATLYGYPLAWLSRLVLAPEYVPWRIDWANLIIDVVVWTVMIGLAMFILTRIKK